jgi:hypothetical protein
VHLLKNVILKHMLLNVVEFLHHLHHQLKTLQHNMVNLHHHHNNNNQQHMDNLHQLNKNLLMLALVLPMVFMAANAVKNLLHVPDKKLLILHALQDKLSILKP